MGYTAEKGPQMKSATLSDWALEVTREALEEELPKRWLWVQAAIEKARRFAPAVPGEEDLLLAATPLSVIGFAPSVKQTGFSTLDGAWYVRDQDGPKRLVDLVAHLCVGSVEAELRGLAQHYTEFGPDEGGPVRDALWTICVTVGPDGGDWTLEQRIDEWLHGNRHPESLAWVSQYVERCQAELEGAVRRTGERMGEVA